MARDAGTGLSTDHRFTSQIEDASIGLYWYASRAYDPMLGRFCQADTIVPGAGNPQALNRFGYVLNNPLRFTDPTGRAYIAGEGEVEYYPHNGQQVKVVGNAEGKYKDILNAFNAEAMTLGVDLVISAVDIHHNDELMKHEMAHVDQAMHFPTSGDYLTAYGAAYVWASLRYGSDYAYVMHPMERQASLHGNGDEFWHAKGRPLPPQLPWMSLLVPSSWSKQPPSTYYQPPGAPSLADGVTLGGPGPDAFVPVEWMIPAEVAPGGVGVVGITDTNRSGSPANGGNWVSPGGANAEADAEVRREAWVRAGSSDYNRPRYDSEGNVSGYWSVYE